MRNRFRGSLKFHAKFIGLDLPADKIPVRRHFTDYKLYQMRLDTIGWHVNDARKLIIAR